MPAWAAEQVARCDRPVVVRRAVPLGAGWVPVGLRGATRAERCAAHAYGDDVLRTVTPEDIARGASWRRRPAPEASAAVRLLARVAPLLDASPFAWGVAGGVGYELAGGADVLRPESDLDLLLRAPSPAAAQALRELAAALDAARAGGDAAGAATRIDVQVEAPGGAFALAEWARGDAYVMLRTPAGPRLVADPWQDGPGADGAALPGLGDAAGAARAASPPAPPGDGAPG